MTERLGSVAALELSSVRLLRQPKFDRLACGMVTPETSRFRLTCSN